MSSPVTNRPAPYTPQECAQIGARCNMLGSLTGSLFFATVVSSVANLCGHYPINRTARVLAHPLTLFGTYAVSHAAFVYTQTIANECFKTSQANRP